MVTKNKIKWLSAFGYGGMLGIFLGHYIDSGFVAWVLCFLFTMVAMSPGIIENHRYFHGDKAE